MPPLATPSDPRPLSGDDNERAAKPSPRCATCGLPISGPYCTNCPPPSTLQAPEPGPPLPLLLAGAFLLGLLVSLLGGRR